MKRVFGRVEVVFDILYLSIAFFLGLYFLSYKGNGVVKMAGIMGLVLAVGDSFHLLPRIMTILKTDEERYRAALGLGKLITSITMTVFYLFLYQIGTRVFEVDIPWLWTVLVVLSILRIGSCFFPQNKWFERYPPVKWSIIRNVPFFVIGVIVALFYLVFGRDIEGFRWMWVAILLSFAFYLPVVLWVNKNPKIGMFMLPKSCVYLWMLFMCNALL
ncbi:hypothetical protein [Filifactor villosus]|uniref:Uncharacterized protein n=1 Tax=Filifactor villosus TaxID=29374 RepID=A0ABV9QP33_9FIRM